MDIDDGTITVLPIYGWKITVDMNVRPFLTFRRISLFIASLKSIYTTKFVCASCSSPSALESGPSDEVSETFAPADAEMAVLLPQDNGIAIYAVEHKKGV